MGISVDYILYVVDRIRREYRRFGDSDQAIRRAISYFRHGGYLYADDHGGRGPALVLDVRAALLGGNGAAVGLAYDHALARGDYARARDILDRAPALCRLPVRWRSWRSATLTAVAL
jgi:hypothetical protein